MLFQINEILTTHPFSLFKKEKYVLFNENVKATSNLEDLQETDYLIISLPSQNIREVLKKYSFRKKNQQIIIASKGIEIETGLLLSDIVKELIDTENINILSGPCFSQEVAQNLPTAVTLAAPNRMIFEDINILFQNKKFRLYFSDDLIGCQLGGAIKNIYAIAAGITMGLNLGENAKSALISRSFVEISRLGKFFKVKSNTLFGLSGLGDLILTCNSLKSRNTTFGHLIASQQQINIKEHLKSQETTEGYFTVKAVKNIADENKITMPIMEAIYNILYNHCPINDEINKLLDRPATNEFY